MNDEKFKKHCIQFAAIGVAYMLMIELFGSFSDSFQNMRFADCLLVLPSVTPSATPGLIFGWILGSNLRGYSLIEVLTYIPILLLGCIGTTILRKYPPFISIIPYFILNSIYQPIMLVKVYHVKLDPFSVTIKVILGQLFCCIVIGTLLWFIIKMLTPRESIRQDRRYYSMRRDKHEIYDTRRK